MNATTPRLFTFPAQSRHSACALMTTAPRPLVAASILRARAPAPRHRPRPPCSRSSGPHALRLALHCPWRPCPGRAAGHAERPPAPQPVSGPDAQGFRGPQPRPHVLGGLSQRPRAATPQGEQIGAQGSIQASAAFKGPGAGVGIGQDSGPAAERRVQAWVLFPSAPALTPAS